MKTIEEKAEAYDAAIVRAKAMIRVAANQDEAIGFANTIFPELKESEDERISKFISNELACLRATDGKGSDRYEELTEAIAWLEKQGDPHIACSEEQMDELENEYLKSIPKY